MSDTVAVVAGEQTSWKAALSPSLDALDRQHLAERLLAQVGAAIPVAAHLHPTRPLGQRGEHGPRLE